MYWNNTTGNVFQTQVALKFLCSHTEIEATAPVLLEKHHLCFCMLQKDVIHYSLIKNSYQFLPIKNYPFQTRSQGLSHYTKFNSGVSSDGVKKN